MFLILVQVQSLDSLFIGKSAVLASPSVSAKAALTFMFWLLWMTFILTFIKKNKSQIFDFYDFNDGN